MIGIIQIVNHIPMMNINVPSNTINFYKIIIPIVNYDFLGSFDWFNDILIAISRTKTEKEEETDDDPNDKLPDDDEIPY